MKIECQPTEAIIEYSGPGLLRTHTQRARTKASYIAYRAVKLAENYFLPKYYQNSNYI